MEITNKRKERENAFDLYKSGLNQKQISHKLNRTEKTIGNWKAVDKWDQKLIALERTKVSDAYFLIAENIRQQSFPPIKSGQPPLLNAEKLNQAVTLLGQTLTDHNLI